jgi:hypothetical protein
MGDFQEALAGLLDEDAPNLSPSVVARLRVEWETGDRDSVGQMGSWQEDASR